MKTRLLLSLFALLTATTAVGADVEINETTFPDENFRNWVRGQSFGKDSILSRLEISFIKTIDVSDRNIKSLKGIEYFTALKELRCYNNQLTALDLSKNTALTSLHCYQNQISGDAMDAFVANLPTTKNRELYVIYDMDEQNVMNEAQVAAAKAKGWTPHEWAGGQWQEYEGMEAYIEISEENFPDENFRAWVLSQEYGKDGKLSRMEIAGVTSIDVKNRRIQTLQGIELFTALTELYCDINKLTTLDVLQNTALKSLSCSDNLLTTLDLSQNTNLTIIVCSDNQLAALDVSGCTALTQLHCSYNQLAALDVSQNTALTYLDCSSNQLTALDVSGCTALTELSCYDNQLTALDMSQNALLTNLSCGFNQLTALDVSQNTVLTSIDCYYNQLTALDVSRCTALTELRCSDNPLATLNVSGCTALTELKCYSNQLTTLDVSGCTALRYLWCYQNQISGDAMDALVASLPTTRNCILYVIYDVDEQNAMTAVQVVAAKAKGWAPKAFVSNKWQEYEGMETYIEISEENFPDENFRAWVLSQSYGTDGMLSGTEIVKVTIISVNNKDIQTLQGIEFFTALTKLNCSGNQLMSIDMSKNTALKNLYCDNNLLTSIDVSKNTALTELYCDNNQLTTLDVSKNTALKNLYCDNNLLTSIDMSKNTALTSLRCYQNQLTALDVSQNTALTYLECSRNQLTVLDVSQNTALKNLYCDNNLLTSIDVSKNTALKNLYCVNNLLTSLDVSKNIALTNLQCYNNQLTVLDLSKNTALTSLHCYQNQISGDAMDAFVASLPTKSNGIMYVIYNENEGNVMTYVQVNAAKAKGWIPYYYDGSQWQRYEGLDVYIEISEENFPDENFRAWVLSQSYGADGKLSRAEIAKVTSISVDGKEIQSLLGIELFTALTELNCSGNQLTTIDLSKNTALAKLYCYNNQLTALDISKNTALTKLYCYNNQLSTLDVSGCTALTYLDCYKNQISGDAMNTFVASLQTTNNGIMHVIYNENEGNEMTMAQVDAAWAKGWTPYYYYSGQWHKYEGVDAYIEICEENFPDENFRAWVLSQSYGADGRLSRTEIAGVTRIAVISMEIQTMQGIEFFTALTNLNCGSNQLTALNMSKNTGLTYLDCGSNQLTALNVSKNTALKELRCHNNQLTALDVSQNKALTTLRCYQNQISGDAMDLLVASLPTTSNGKIYVIYYIEEQNEMTIAQMTAAKAKGWTSYYYNSDKWEEYEGMEAYTEISKENFPDENFRAWVLKQEYGTDGKLSGKEISGVTRIAVGSKGIQTLQGIELFTALKELLCYNNQLTTLDVTQNTALTELECYNNQLTALDVSQNSALKKLNCYKNKLTELNLSENNTELTTLYCYQNEIAGTAMDAFVESLPTISSGKMRVICDKDEQNVMTIVQVAAAKAKGWIPQYLVDGVWKEYPGSDNPDAIRAIDNGQLTIDNESVYNLAGQRLQKMQRGVNIVGGKKVLMK